MNEGRSVTYNKSYTGQKQVYTKTGKQNEKSSRHYPLEVLQVMGGAVRNGVHNTNSQPGQQILRKPHTRDRYPNGNRDTNPFGYESDDSSLSSNTSGSIKSLTKGQSHGSSRNGESIQNQARAVTSSGSTAASDGGNGAPREWRCRGRYNNPHPPTRDFNYAHSHAHRVRRTFDRLPIVPLAPYPYQVKYPPEDLLNGSSWDQLSQEMWNNFIKSQQTEETFRKKMTLWRYLFVTIKSLFPRYGLYVVGSTMSGFGLDSSDMDLCLFVRPVENIEPRAQALLHLSYILTYVKNLDHEAQLIQAKVPILKFKDCSTGLQVDLNCNNVVGIRNTSLLHFYTTFNWRVRPLVVITKLWARAHNINDARRSSLSSYALTLMVIHFLQYGISPPILPCVHIMGWDCVVVPHNKATLGELFLRFLGYYAEFQYDKMAVSVRAGRPIPVVECRSVRSYKNDPHQWKLICVEEPFDLTNTARSVYDPDTFHKIVNTFKESYKRLSTSHRLADAWPRDQR